MKIKKENIKLRNDEDIEIIKIDNLTPSEKKDYAGSLIEISKLAGQDPKDHVYDWLDVTDLLIFAKSKNNNSAVGFSSIGFLDNNVLHIAATMIIPEYQKKGIVTILTKTAIKYFFINKRGILEFWKPVYVLFRTQNPLVYFDFYRRNLPIYPNPKKEFKPDEKIIEIAKKNSKKLWPYAEFDDETFVLKGAYKLHPFLIINPENISWSKNESVNNFFRDRLNIDEKSEDALVTVIKVKLLDLLLTNS